jgi:1,2-diacylglycerol 3-alpha-glucosyltransferase
VNIGFFTDSYTPQINGIVTSINFLVNELEVLGHRVHVFAPAMGSFTSDRDGVYRLISVRCVENPPYYFATPFSLRVLTLIPRLHLDIVHMHTPLSLGFIAYQVARIYHLPLVYTYHTLVPEYTHYIRILNRAIINKKFSEIADAFVCNLCDHIIAPSAKVKRLLLKYEVKTPVTVISNAIQTERFSRTERGYLHRRLGLREARRMVLTVGRLGPEKNLEFLLRAFAQVAAKSSVHLVIVGEGYARPSLEQLADRLSIKDQVTFLGNIPYVDMPKVYADADLFVSSSVSESHSMVLLEALAAGLPVVAVRDEALESTVINGINGYLTGLDEEEFASKADAILARSDTWRAMSEASQRISERFSIQIQVQQLLEVYDRVRRSYQR